MMNVLDFLISRDDKRGPENRGLEIEAPLRRRSLRQFGSAGWYPAAPPSGMPETTISRLPRTFFTSDLSACMARRTTVWTPLASKARATRPAAGSDLLGTGGLDCTSAGT